MGASLALFEWRALWLEWPGGNSNNQDPWGSGGGGRRGGGGDQKGPPDLDEAFRKLQDSLNGMFGGKKRGGGNFGGSGKRGGFGLVWVALVVLLAVWLFNAIYIVDEQEQAVVLRFGKVSRDGGAGPEHLLPADRPQVPGERDARALVQQAGADAHRG